MNRSQPESPDFWLDCRDFIGFGPPRACYARELVSSVEGVRYLRVGIDPAFDSELATALSVRVLEGPLDELLLAAHSEGHEIDAIEHWPFLVGFGTLRKGTKPDKFHEAETLHLGNGTLWRSREDAIEIVIDETHEHVWQFEDRANAKKNLE